LALSKPRWSSTPTAEFFKHSPPTEAELEAATLLILREFMHHLHFAGIQVLGPPVDAKA
jgi:hypothetical protein